MTSIPHARRIALLSRRPRARARSGQRGWTLPDWAWGLSLGIVVLGFVGGYFLVTGTGGGGTDCGSPLTPLGRSNIDAAAFQEQDDLINELIDKLTAGDLDGVNATFYGKPVHNFSHNVDPVVRDADEDAGKRICEAVLAFEDGLVFEEPAAALILEATTMREAIRDGAQALGYPRPE